MDLVTATTEMNSLFSVLKNTLGTSASIIAIAALLPCLCNFILTIVAKWQILDKAEMSGWAALIPFYGRFCFYDITWDNGWISLASYIPGVSYVLNVITMVKLSCRFEKSSIFTLGLVLFEPIFLAMLGFDDSEFTYYD